MSKDGLPEAKVGKVYPITYFSKFDKKFSAKNNTFKYRNWLFERVGRNKLKVLEMPD